MDEIGRTGAQRLRKVANAAAACGVEVEATSILNNPATAARELIQRDPQKRSRRDGRRDLACGGGRDLERVGRAEIGVAGAESEQARRAEHGNGRQT